MPSAPLSSIPTITLKSGAAMPQLGLGTWRLQGRECTQAVKAALALGYTHIDTAEMYGNEKEIGAAIEGTPRERLFITSKVWLANLAHDDVISACDGTLGRLGTPYVDLYLVHWPSREIPVADTLRALDKLVRLGKARSIGVSNFTERLLEDAVAAAGDGSPICVNQVEFHPWLYQRELLASCGRLGVALTAYAPIARGTQLDDARLQRIARAHGKTAAQVCLRWAVEKGMAVIPKAGSRAHLEENMAIFDFSLTPAETAQLDAMPQQRLVRPEFAQF